VQLYLQQARCVRPGYEADHEPLAEIGRICRMVEGMPLAIVLAAAWMDVLSPGEIAAELERSITFLRGELHDLPSRHRSMVAAFDVSWGMLTDAEREAFAGLSVFQGGCTREAAEAVAGADLEILRALTQKSFLTRNADGRYHVHELLRQYAEAKLRERSGAWERALDQHCTYYTEYLVQYEASFRKSGPGEAGDEISNVSAAWRWMLDRDKVAACRRAIGGFYWLDPGWAWCRARRPLLEGTIALLRRAEPSRENRIALGMALCYTAQPEIGADLEHARVLAQEGHQILTELDARHELAEAKIYAYFAGIAQDEVHAERLLQESLSLARETGRPEIEAWALGFLGVRCFTRALRTGAPSTEAMQQVQAFYARSLEIRRRIGHRRGEANLLFEQGLCMHAVGRYAEARSLYEKSLAYYRTVGMQASILICLGTLGMLALQVGDYSAAEAAFQEYMQKGQAWDDQVTARYGPCGLADVALAMGQARKAASIRRQVLQDTIEDGLFAERILFSFAQSSAQEGRWTRAAELLALAYTLVYPGFWNIVTVCGGMELEREVRGALPPDVYAAAQERGRARDVEGTLRELLAELEDEGLPDPP
jgi:tetratricopeptide (TPR) repeat protein